MVVALAIVVAKAMAVVLALAVAIIGSGSSGNGIGRDNGNCSDWLWHRQWLAEVVAVATQIPVTMAVTEAY